MSLLTPDWNPSRPQLRHFAWGAALVLAVLSETASTGLNRLSLGLAAGMVLALGTSLPGLFRRPYQILAVLTWPFGWVVGHVLLAGIYFGLLTPLGLLFRAWGRDPLQRRFQPEALTYWQPRRPPADRQRYYRPF